MEISEIVVAHSFVDRSQFSKLALVRAISMRKLGLTHCRLDALLKGQRNQVPESSITDGGPNVSCLLISPARSSGRRCNPEWEREIV